MKDFKYFKVLLKYFKNDKTKFFIFILLTSLLCFQSLLYPLIYSKLLVFLTVKDWSNFVLYFFLWEGLAIFCNILLKIPKDNSFNFLETKFLKCISSELFNKIINLPEKAYEDKSVGELGNRIYVDPNKILEIVTSLINTISRIAMVFMIIFISYKISYLVTIELFVFIIVTFYISNIYFPKIEKNQKELKKYNDNYVKETTQVLTGIREVKALGIKKTIRNSIDSKIDKLFEMDKVQKKSVYNYKYLIYGNYIFFETIILFTVAYLYYTGKIPFESFVLMEMYIWRVDDAIESFSDFGVDYKKVLVSLKRMDEILSNQLYEDEKYGLIDINTKGYIKFDNISFKYSEKDNLILNSLNINIVPNKKIAIVGKSGHGKSTLFNLLLRYFDNYDGNIFIDNVNIKDLTEDSLRNNISIIRQNPYIFNKTIRENFEMIDSNISLRKIKNACKKACIHDYIESLPNKYDTLIGEGGVNLSGGQKQRLAIARTLIKDTKIILFDEATSALDNESQENIKSTIDNLVKDHTVIIVAHRLSTIMDSDIIYIIDQGKVIDSGTHNVLMNRNKLYKNLYSPETTII